MSERQNFMTALPRLVLMTPLTRYFDFEHTLSKVIERSRALNVFKMSTSRLEVQAHWFLYVSLTQFSTLADCVNLVNLKYSKLEFEVRQLKLLNKCSRDLSKSLLWSSNETGSIDTVTIWTRLFNGLANILFSISRAGLISNHQTIWK